MAKGLVRWDPFRLTSRRWDPFNIFKEMQYEMDRMFDRLGGEILPAAGTLGTWMPSVESYLKDNNLIFKCELPGVDPKDAEVMVDDATHQMIIRGQRKTEKDTKEEDYIHREISYGSFERRFTLPEGVKSEHIKARFTNGILEVTVPAPALAAKSRKVEIESPEAEGEKTDIKKAA